MTPYRTVLGRAYPFARRDVDTDLIIPAEHMKTISRSGLGAKAFETLRRVQGNVFDDPAYAGAPILLADANFGCGSSREHAVWALADLGIRVIIAPSIAGIFTGNAFRNGLLVIELSDQAVEQLMAAARRHVLLTVDLALSVVSTDEGAAFPFEIDAFRRACLLDGIDEIALTLGSVDQIAEHEAMAVRVDPWLVPAALRTVEGNDTGQMAADKAP